jgi:hypothetical protein
MTRVSPSSKSPKNQPTIKQQRAARRDEKLAAFRAAEKRRVRVRRIAIISGIVAVVVVAALIIASVVLTPKAPDYSGSASGSIRGVKTFTNTGDHVAGSVTYAQTPPASGPHNATWLNCGAYTKPVPNENAVHALEHGAVWVTYDPALPAADVTKLRALMPATHFVLSPYQGLPSTIVVSGWNRQLQVSSASDSRIPQFFKKYWKGSNAPEPGAACTGGLDAPGKQ